MSTNEQFLRRVSRFHGLDLPEAEVALSGYSALVDHYDLKVPLPDRLSVISTKQKRYETDRWNIFTPRHAPDDTFAGHLTFALKYEGVDLGILSALFKKQVASDIATWVRNEPTGQYSRRIWFLYEWLTGNTLDVEDVTTGNYVEALDPTQHYPGPSTLSKRHRVRNNLPGTHYFCPMIRRTDKLEAFINARLDEKAKESLGAVHADILARAAAFLLLKDSKASYAIEGERPGHNRAERWGRALEQS